MKSLSEFLNEQAEKQPESGIRKWERDAWVSAVGQLIERMELCLREADQKSILDIERTVHEKREEGIGHYKVAGLAIRLGAREVDIIPISRYVVATPANVKPFNPQGRVDMTDGETRYSLYRIPDSQGVGWALIDPTGSIKGFSQKTFEAAIQDLLE